MSPKLYIYFAIFVLTIGFIKWYSGNQYDAGYNAHKAEVADIRDEADIEGQADVETVIEWRTKEKVVYRDKIKYIDSVEDATGCLDTKLVDMGISLQ